MSQLLLESKKLPESCRQVIRIIYEEGPLSSKEIVQKVSCSTRSVRYALKRLLDAEIVEKHPCLQDMRQTLYSVKLDQIKEEIVKEKIFTTLRRL